MSIIEEEGKDLEMELGKMTSLCRLTRGSIVVDDTPTLNTKIKKKTAQEQETDKRRSGKWIYMVRKLQLSEKISESDLKRRARKGIPDGVRGSAWPTLAYSNEAIPENY